MKNIFKNLLKKRCKIVITFTEMPGRKMDTIVKIDGGIPVQNVLSTLDRMSGDIKRKLTNKAQANGLSYKNTQTREFIKNQKVGDLI